MNVGLHSLNNILNISFMNEKIYIKDEISLSKVLDLKNYLIKKN